jgi:hypothetical protein
MANSIKNVFPNMMDSLAASFNMVSTLPEIKMVLPQHQKEALDILKTSQYLDINELEITVPEGFNGSLVEYAKCVDLVAGNLLNTVEKVLTPYSVYLSQLISNKEIKLSTKDMTPFFNSLTALREQNLKALNGYIGEDYKTKVKLGLVVNRKADIEELFQHAASANKKIQMINLKSIESHVKKCVELLNVIIKQVESGTITNVSPEVVVNLAFGATEIATEVEFISIFYFRTIAFNNTVDNITQTLHNYARNTH